MATTTHKAYTQAATTALSGTNVIDGLANAGISSTASAAIDNTTNLDLFMDLELNLAAPAATRTAGATINVYMIQALDGTNYDTLNATAADLVCVFPLDAAQTAIRASRRDIPIPPGLFKLFVLNSTGAATAASGNTLKYRTHSIQTA